MGPSLTEMGVLGAFALLLMKEAFAFASKFADSKKHQSCAQTSPTIMIDKMQLKMLDKISTNVDRVTEILISQSSVMKTLVREVRDLSDKHDSGRHRKETPRELDTLPPKGR